MRKKILSRLLLTVVITAVFMWGLSGISRGEDEITVARQVYMDYFKTQSINYSHAINLFGEENAPTACFFALKSKTDLAGMNKIFIKNNNNWSKVMAHFKIKEDSLFLPVSDNYKVGPPYGNAYGYWKKHQKNSSEAIVLTNDDIFNLVNLNIIHKHFNLPVEDIMKYRGENKSFNWIITNQQNKVKSSSCKDNQGQGNSSCKGNQGQGNKDKSNDKGKNKNK